MNRVVHFEIQGRDQNALQKFYQELFGWEFQLMGPDMGNYRVIVTGKNSPDSKNMGINGGMPERKGDIPSAGAPVNGFVCIVDVADTDATVQKAQELGGTVAVEAMEVPTVGRLAYLLDPENNIFGVLTPDMSGMAPQA